VIHWLNQNSGAVQAISVMVLIAVTAVYAWFTRQMAKQIEDESRPYVTIDFEMSSGAINLGIENAGNRAATDVTFRVLKDVAGLEPFGTSMKAAFSELPVIRKGIRYLSPNRRLLFLFQIEHEVFKETRPAHELQLEVQVAYRYGGKSYQYVVPFDLSLYREGMLYKSFADGAENSERSTREIVNAIRSLKEPRFHFLGVARTCEYCDEKIMAGAKKCPHCHEWLTQSSTTSTTSISGNRDSIKPATAGKAKIRRARPKGSTSDHDPV
jgi:hypothetical protein